MSGMEPPTNPMPVFEVLTSPRRKGGIRVDLFQLLEQLWPVDWEQWLRRDNVARKRYKKEGVIFFRFTCLTSLFILKTN